MKNTKSKEKKEIQLEFQIKAIEILDFKLHSNDKMHIESKLFHFNISIMHKIASEKKIVFVIISVEVLHLH